MAQSNLQKEIENASPWPRGRMVGSRRECSANGESRRRLMGVGDRTSTPVQMASLSVWVGACCVHLHRKCWAILTFLELNVGWEESDGLGSIVPSCQLRQFTTLWRNSRGSCKNAPTILQIVKWLCCRRARGSPVCDCTQISKWDSSFSPSTQGFASSEDKRKKEIGWECSKLSRPPSAKHKQGGWDMHDSQGGKRQPASQLPSGLHRCKRRSSRCLTV